MTPKLKILGSLLAFNFMIILDFSNILMTTLYTSVMVKELIADSQNAVPPFPYKLFAQLPMAPVKKWCPSPHQVKIFKLVRFIILIICTHSNLGFQKINRLNYQYK